MGACVSECGDECGGECECVCVGVCLCVCVLVYMCLLRGGGLILINVQYIWENNDFLRSIELN